MKHASLCSSITQGGGKWRAVGMGRGQLQSTSGHGKGSAGRSNRRTKQLSSRFVMFLSALQWPRPPAHNSLGASPFDLSGC
jgi:hypothetical protein